MKPDIAQYTKEVQDTGENEPVTHELEEAYAKLFGGIAAIFENLVGEPNGEDAGDKGKPKDASKPQCDCCDQNCNCGDCQNC